jgi:predicted CoA-binding protein
VQASAEDFGRNLIDSDDAIAELIARTRRIAVLGIKTERQANQPAFYVPRYLASTGFEIIPVPVYFPEVKEILGRPVYRRLVDVPGEVDLVEVFRQPKDIEMHVDDIIAKRPKAVWFQLGIRNDAAAQRLAGAGIQVVQDRCLMVEHRRLAR